MERVSEHLVQNLLREPSTGWILTLEAETLNGSVTSRGRLFLLLLLLLLSLSGGVVPSKSRAFSDMASPTGETIHVELLGHETPSVSLASAWSWLERR